MHVFIIISIGFAEEFRFHLSSESLVKFNSHHWQHPTSNAAIDFNGTQIDIFQWQAIAENKELVTINLVNPIWEFAGWATADIILPNIIEISEVSNFRGTPTIYIKVIPWRINGNKVEVLSDGEINIWIEDSDFSNTFSHPYLLNGKKNHLHRTFVDTMHYLIIYPLQFASAAEQLEKLHSSDVPGDYQLIVEKVTVEEIIAFVSTYNTLSTNYAIRSYIDSMEYNISMDFLLLLGDETHIPAIHSSDNSYPSDDFYTTSSGGIYTTRPQLITGRIPIRTAEEASVMVNKIREYILHPAPGIWRSKIALVADDMYLSCSIDAGESSHTAYSQILYDSLKTLIPVLPYYGVHYNMHNCSYPDLTRDLIQTINNGVAFINYIGHGDPETWAGEKIIDRSRDMPLIHPSGNRLSIWVAGTCSFGNYYEENSFMEELLKKDDGAIAVVATTDVIGYTPNWNYIKSFFGLNNESGIADYFNKEENIRLGELVYNAKNMNNDYKFHTFGDPALLIPLPKIQNLINDDDIEEIHLVTEEQISFFIDSNNSDSESQYSSIQIRKNEKEFVFDYGVDSLNYTIPGETYLQMEFTGISQCFHIPIDAGSCTNCVVMQAYKENTGWDGKIETIPNISLLYSNENFNDNQGPEILLYQKNITISEGSAIFPNMNLIVSLNDQAGINLMNESIGHGIRYAFDDQGLILIPGNEFLFTDCDAGSVIIPVPLTLQMGVHKFYLEAWDGLNNKSTLEIYFDLLPPIDEDKLNISHIYPIPSPFTNNTYFTMITTHFPVEIIINIFSLNGSKIKTIYDSINICEDSFSDDEGCFIKINWDGTDAYGHNIANGTYFYHLKVETESGQIFEDIFKIAKIE